MEINELEDLRQKIVKKEKKVIIIGTSITIFVTLVLVLLFKDVFSLWILALGMFEVFKYTQKVTKVEKEKFAKSYKEVVFRGLFDFLFNSVYVNLEQGLSRDTIERLDMIRMGKIFVSNDYITAKYKNVSFEFSDVLIQEEYEDDNRSKRIETFFKGQWYVFQFNKQFKADIQICGKNFRHARGGNEFRNQKFQKLEFEEIDFNNNFDVYSTNDVEAFCFLTPTIMEKLKEINQKTNGDLMFCFMNNQLHVAVNNSIDLFEPVYSIKVDIKTGINNAKSQLKIIVQLIEILDLDSNFFM